MASFNALISGITNCGKTEYVLDLIFNKYNFEYVLIFCPTIKVNGAYRRNNLEIFESKRFVLCDTDDL